MWAVSPAFLQALPQSRTLVTTCTLTTPAGAQSSLAFVSGTVSAGGSGIIRRTAPLVVAGDSTLYRQLATPGTIIDVRHGLDLGGGNIETVPMIHGELAGAAKEIGNGLVSFTVADWGQRVEGANYVQAFAPAATANRLQTIADAITGAVPTTVSTTASDTSQVGTSQVWSSRSQMVASLLTDAGAEGFFLPDGTFRIRDVPQTTDQPAWIFRTGDGGTIESFTRQRPLDKLYNTVVVTPAALDGSQTWTQVVAQIADASNPRDPRYIGVRPYVWQSPTIMTAAQAQAVANTLLGKVQGSTETISLGAFSNPALEVGDVIRATDPTDAGTGIIQALLDSFTIDLASGSMTLQTRAAVEGLT